ncbi:ParA family protein [Noviherbaspirillum pedocola]|uniref:ParA family protein n=1 Tax=Noviherbaspirillum pedocola TaxID=2801341 RepID=A0A934T488_9BURK|nr:ParA family protein [Noviherbaspirillum pedocola]MBK4739088.1 ParA family protein [Noviherbaspirillum pedocola]
MAAKVVTFFNQKGGCGKTTMTIQIAGTIAQRGFRTLVVDMDSQSTATRWASQAQDEDPFPAAMMNLAAMGGKVHREIKNHLENYDFIFIDCPPAVDSPAPSSAMLISDLAIIPIVPAPADMWASVAAKKLALTAQATNEQLQIRMLPNMVQKNTNLARDTLDVLAEDVEIPLMKTWIGSRSAFRECQLFGSTVHKVAKSSPAVKEVDKLTDEVLEILGVATAKRSKK